MHIIINQLIIQWTLNKHFTWHLLILCSCMSFCCLTRMHEVFFLQGSSLPLSKSTSGHKQFINSGFPELSCNLVPGKILSCYHANNLKWNCNYNTSETSILLRSSLIVVKFHTIKKVYLCSWNCNFYTLYKVFNIFLLKLITYNYIGVKIILSITKVFSASVLGKYIYRYSNGK